MDLNKDQVRAVNGTLDAFYAGSDNAPNADGVYGRTIMGEGGTGKTFSVVEIARDIMENEYKVLFTAPTNKAVKQLQKACKAAGLGGDIGFATIHSALGLGMAPSDENKFVFKSKESILPEYDLLVIDEGSMLNKVMLYNYLIPELINSGRTFLLVMGDDMQLPPVREQESLAFKMFIKYTLTIVERQKNNPDGTPNGILELCQPLRAAIEAGVQHTVETMPAHNVTAVQDVKFMPAVLEAFTLDTDLEQVRVIAWRNDRVDFINNKIREKIYGPDASLFEVGERIVTGGPVKRGSDIILGTDEECWVSAVSESSVTYEPTGDKWRTLMLTLKPIYAEVAQVFAHIIHPDEQHEWDNELNRRATLAKNAVGREKGKLWGNFWHYKEMMADIRYCYCITGHRAQGSTYKIGFVDLRDIMDNPRRSERQKLFYVGLSRFQDHVTINKLRFTV